MFAMKTTVTLLFASLAVVTNVSAATFDAEFLASCKQIAAQHPQSRARARANYVLEAVSVRTWSWNDRGRRGAVVGKFLEEAPQGNGKTLIRVVDQNGRKNLIGTHVLCAKDQDIVKTLRNPTRIKRMITLDQDSLRQHLHLERQQAQLAQERQQLLQMQQALATQQLQTASQSTQQTGGTPFQTTELGSSGHSARQNIFAGNTVGQAVGSNVNINSASDQGTQTSIFSSTDATTSPFTSVTTQSTRGCQLPLPRPHAGQTSARQCTSGTGADASLRLAVQRYLQSPTASTWAGVMQCVASHPTRGEDVLLKDLLPELSQRSRSTDDATANEAIARLYELQTLFGSGVSSSGVLN